MGISLTPIPATDTEGRTPEQLAGFSATAVDNTTGTGGGAVQGGSGGGDVTRCLFAGGGAVVLELTAWPTSDTALAALAGGALPDHALDVWIDLTGQHPLYLHGAVVQGTGAPATAIALRWWDGAAWSPLGRNPTTGASDVDVLLPCADAGAVLGSDVTLALAARALIRVRPFAVGAVATITALQLASLHATARPGLPRPPAATAAYVVPMTGPESLSSLTGGQPAWGTDWSEFADTAALAAAVGTGVEGDFRNGLSIVNGPGGTAVDGTVTFDAGDGSGAVHTVKSTETVPGTFRGLQFSAYIDAYASPWTGRQCTELWMRTRLKVGANYAGVYFQTADLRGVPDTDDVGAGIDVYGGSVEFFQYDGAGGVPNFATAADSLLVGAAGFVDSVLRVRVVSGGFAAQAWLIDPGTGAALWSPGEFTNAAVPTPPTGFVLAEAMTRGSMPSATENDWCAGMQVVDGSAHSDPWNVLAAGL